MIEIKHLRTLATLDQTGSLVNTADVLCLTQSALSHQIKELESRLDCRLFERKSQPVRFTEQGQMLLALAKKVLPQVEHVRKQLKSINSHEPCELTLSVECHACFHWLLPIIQRFNKTHPHIKVRFDTEIRYDGIDALLLGELEMVLTSDVRLEQHVEYTALFDFEMRLIVAPQHPLASKAHIAPADLAEQTLISYPIPKERQDVFNYFMPIAGFSGKHKTVDQGQYLLQLVAAEQGIAVVPDWLCQSYVDQQLVVSKALGHGLHRTMYLAVQKPVEHPAITEFIQCCVKND